jgi:hypothetical protein
MKLLHGISRWLDKQVYIDTERSFSPHLISIIAKEAGLKAGTVRLFHTAFNLCSGPYAQILTSLQLGAYLSMFTVPPSHNYVASLP